jgi:hypothetical protein
MLLMHAALRDAMFVFTTVKCYDLLYLQHEMFLPETD